jgi:hypothetical protein
MLIGHLDRGLMRETYLALARSASEQSPNQQAYSDKSRLLRRKIVVSQ